MIFFKKAGTFSIQMDTAEDKDVSIIGSYILKCVTYIKCQVSTVILVS